MPDRRSGRTIVALVYGQVYHLVEDGKTLCGENTRGSFAWIAYPKPPPDLRECRRCGASTRRFVEGKEEA